MGTLVVEELLVFFYVGGDLGVYLGQIVKSLFIFGYDVS